MDPAERRLMVAMIVAGMFSGKADDVPSMLRYPNGASAVGNYVAYAVELVDEIERQCPDSEAP